MIEPTPITTYTAEVNPFAEVDFFEEAKERETEQFKNKDVFNRFLELLLQDQTDFQQALKEVMQERNLDNAEGEQLDVIGRILGQPRVLFDSVIIRYFGFNGATGASPYKSVNDTERTFGPYKGTRDSLLGVRELTDREYRRLLRLTIIKNTSDATITSFTDGMKLLFGLEDLDYQEAVPADYAEGAATITVSIGRDYNDSEKAAFPGLDEITLAERFLNKPLGVGILYQNPITFFANFQTQLYQMFVYGSYGLSTRTFDDLFDFSRNYTADYYDSNGGLQTAAIDEPRMGYDPNTLEPIGLLINSPEEILTHTWGLEVNDSQGTIRIELTQDDGSAREAALIMEGVDFKFILFREDTYWKVRVEYETTESYEMIIPQVTSDSIVATVSYTPNQVYFNIEDEERRAALSVDYGDTNIRGFDMRIGGSFTTNSNVVYDHFNGSIQNIMYLRPFIGGTSGGVFVEDGISITTEDYKKILADFGQLLVT